MKTRGNDAKRHKFGGTWPSAKLEVLAGYLRGYTTALKETPFKKGYIDAFAGTGYREASRAAAGADQERSPLFPDLAQAEPQELLEGSAVKALRTEPRFDCYVFIERSPRRCVQLEALRRDFPALSQDIMIRRGEANQKIQKMCSNGGRITGQCSFSIPTACRLNGKLLKQ